VESAVIEVLQRMSATLDGLLRKVDPEALSPRDAVRVLEAAVNVEQRAAALKALVVARAASDTAWASEGHRCAEAWLAAKTGSGFGEAAATLGASEKLGELPGLSEALRAGEVSGPQLRELASAATPENEDRLLAAKDRQNLSQLRKTCAREKRSASTVRAEAARHARIHKGRYHREWYDSEGAWCYEGRGTAMAGAKASAIVNAAADQVFKEAWAEGRRESAAAYRFDGLMRVLEGGGASVKTEVVIRVDAERLAGGHGSCETSAGEVPVDDAIGAILAGAFTKIVLRDGVDVTKVKHIGRHIPAEIKTAVMERDGYMCVRPSCGATQHLEIHHYRVDYAKGGETAYWNLLTTCGHDHDLCTNDGYRFGGGPGNWTWIPPP
jgi:hypothetical protein